MVPYFSFTLLKYNKIPMTVKLFNNGHPFCRAFVTTLEWMSFILLKQACMCSCNLGLTGGVVFCSGWPLLRGIIVYPYCTYYSHDYV